VVEARPAGYVGLSILLAVLFMVSPFSIDTFFPSFHAIAAEFDLTNWQLQQLMTVYLLPLGLMSLVQGPLSDALGRRPVLLAGLIVYVLASIACTLAPNYPTLLIFRAMQGMCAGVGMIIGRAVIRDLYEGPPAQRLMSVISMIFSIAPAIAPVIGGYIHVAFGWRAVFGFMAILGLVLIVASYVRLPETHPREKRVPFHVSNLARVVWTVISNREALLIAFCIGAHFATMLTIVGAAPAIVIDHWGLKETQFAWLFVPVIGGFALGAWVSGRLAGRLTSGQQCMIGFAVSIIGALSLVVLCASIERPPIWAQQIAFATTGFGVQIVMPVLTLRMMDMFPDARGSAASVQSCVSLIVATVAFGVMVPLLNHSLLHLAEGTLSVAIVALVLWKLSQLKAKAA